MKPKEFNLNSFHEPNYLSSSYDEMQDAFDTMYSMQFQKWSELNWGASTAVLGRISVIGSILTDDDSNLFDASHYWRLQVNEIIGLLVAFDRDDAVYWSGDLRITSIDAENHEIVVEMADGSNFTDNPWFTGLVSTTNTETYGPVIEARLWRRIIRNLDHEYLTDYGHKIKKIYAPNIHNTADRHYNSLGGHVIHRKGEYRQDITSKVIIVKDGEGNVYWPEFDYNGIGDFKPGGAYQIKMKENLDPFKFLPVKEDNDELIDD
jgi:hypothetical protein